MDFIKLIFTFKTEDIWNIARLRSANIANHIKENGVTQESSLALTDSERDLWNISMRYPASKVYSYLMSAGKIQEGDYEYDITETSGAKIIKYTLYVHPDWDKNLTRELNDFIEKALVSGGLMDWYKDTHYETFLKLEKDYNETLGECKFTINKRKYPTVRKHITF